AYVPQGNLLFSGTVLDNLTIVKPEATEEEIRQAVFVSCMDEFVQKLPDGLHTVLGESGTGLSEGQAQRIAIARALVRKATVMLLDEVTSALDYATEQRVLKQLMRRGITCILATHRLSVLSMCDHAYRVREGRVELLTGEELANLIAFE
ncbi:MAG: ATP-binding cassette domain-containing protein, partial [Oscillospiraceae bacterium]|nr:ATP-binding cassette domain-containing protein [Oscillospiraceae bacterium]